MQTAHAKRIPLLCPAAPTSIDLASAANRAHDYHGWWLSPCAPLAMPPGTRVLPAAAFRESVNRMVSTVNRVERRSHADGALRRAITVFIALTWIASSLVCPVPARADHAFAQAGHSTAPAVDGYENHRPHGDSHGNDKDDLCCDILAQVYASAGPLKVPLYHKFVSDYGPLSIDGLNLVAAAATDEAVSLQLHGPEPPRRSWPQFTKVWSQAPPADHV